MTKYHVIIPQGMNPMPERLELSTQLYQSYFSKLVEKVGK
jgi:hypothetical protein